MSHEECWSLDITFYRWLDEHLSVYLEDAGKLIDMDTYKYEFDGKEMTQRECIEEMISLVKFIRGEESFASPELKEKTTHLLRLWADVCPMMWL